MSRFGRIFHNLWQKSDWLHVVDLDLGSFNTKLLVDGKREFQVESSYLKHLPSQSIVAIGQKTLDYYDDDLPQINLIRPFRGGRINHHGQTLEFLSHLLEQFFSKSKYGLRLPRMLARVAVSPRYSPVQKQILTKMLQKTGAIEVELIEKNLAIYRSQIKPQTQGPPLLIVDIGAETTLIGLCHGQQVVKQTVFNKGSWEFNRIIQRVVKTKHQSQIGFKTAEKIKKELGRLDWVSKPAELKLAVRGKDILSNLPTTITVTVADFEEEFQRLGQEISSQVSELVASLSFNEVQGVMESGLFITGGGSLIRGWSSFLEDQIKMNVRVSSEPFRDVIRGMIYAGR